MSDSSTNTNPFLAQVTAAVEKNLSDERFGVSELAAEMHMSRSNLLRRIRQSTNQSASQLIREIRLKRGMELLRAEGLTVSEVAHRVGFGGTSYFIKCFREYYGYPPGEAVKRKEDEGIRQEPVEGGIPHRSRPAFRWLFLIAILLVLSSAAVYWLMGRQHREPVEKSLVVLPFKNDSDDSTNRYLINGLMEATLNHLQQIKDLRVVSRTSAEKYRHTVKSIPELANELDVSYVVEGSGQKVGNRILLNVQLIDARKDSHLWARQYEREATDIFRLQQEIAKDIASEIRAIVTWEEQQRIERIPTSDLVAYDLFLKATELMRQGGRERLQTAVSLLDSAIARDPEFSLAYAVTAIAYYYLDVFQARRQHGQEIGRYADKALLHDPSAAESLFAKGLFYVNQKEYQQAIPYLEKSLAYNPNSPMIIHFLADFYNTYVPNTSKYLEYALQGIRLDPAAHDSATTSLNYLHLSNALVQTGFVDEALRYIEKSLAYHPDNSYAQWLRAVVVYAKYEDPVRAEKLLLAQLAKDSSQMHILQELGKLYFHTGDDESAFHYYQRFLTLRDAGQLDFFPTVDLDMAILWKRRGNHEESERSFARFKSFADNDPSIYRHMYLALYAAYRGDVAEMNHHLELFAKEENFQYWILLFKDDIIVAPYRDNPRFKAIFDTIETKFWKENEDIRAALEDKGLL